MGYQIILEESVVSSAVAAPSSWSLTVFGCFGDWPSGVGRAGGVRRVGVTASLCGARGAGG